MDIHETLKQAIKFAERKISGDKIQPGFSEQRIEAVYAPLAEAMQDYSIEFPAMRLFKASNDLMLRLTVETESTLITSSLVYVPTDDNYYRRDELDLNIPDVIFSLAGKTREETIERHEFIYKTVQDAIDAYVDFIAYWIAQLRINRDNNASDSTNAP